jgi:hypothetical protein
MRPRERRSRSVESGGPKYIVQWQTDFDIAAMTPEEAALEALRELRTNNPLYVHVIDCDTDREWSIGFRDHELEVIEVRVIKPQLHD